MKRACTAAPRSIVVLALLLLAFLAGCDRNVAPYDPDERPREPDLSRIFPEPVEPRPPAAGAEPVVAASPGRAGAAVRGTVHLAEQASTPSGAALFVIARPAGATAGPPLAVVRVPEPRFPFDFEIGPDDVMLPTMRFEGSIELTARLDADGNASTRGDGDRETAAPVAVTPGTLGVELRLE